MPSIIVPTTGEIAWYPDTSFLLFIKNQKDFESVDDPRIAAEVVNEIRAKKDVIFNSYLDILLCRSRIISKETFLREGLGKCYKLILKCAATLCPDIYFAIRHIESLDLPLDEQLKKCILEVQRTSRESGLWARDHFILRGEEYNSQWINEIGPNVFNRTVLQKMRDAYKAWFKYHRERFTKIKKGTYKWADEKIVAYATTEALLKNKVSVILTADFDFNVIMKQLTDNLIIHASYRELRSNNAKVTRHRLNSLFKVKCDEVESFRTNTYEYRLSALLKAEKIITEVAEVIKKAPDKGMLLFRLLMCNPREILVWNTRLVQGSHYVFTSDLIQSVKEYGNIIR